MSERDDFYMVLPSNASPNFHPENNASDFRVTWENPININPSEQWKVALTEMSYTYTPITVSPNYHIIYKKQEIEKRKYSFHLAYNIATQKVTINREHRETNQAVTLQLTQDKKLIIRCDLPFDFNFTEKAKLGFNVASLTSNDVEDAYEIRANESLNRLYPAPVGGKNIVQFGPIELGIHFNNLVQREYLFKNVLYWYKAKGLADYVAKECKEIFSTFELVKSKFHFKTQPYIFEIEFLKGLHFVIGLEKSKYTKDLDIMTSGVYKNDVIEEHAPYPPQMRRGMINMYIYSSICSPIHVGHTLAPLLKSIHIDTSRDTEEGHTRSYVVRNPMYIPLASNSFNSIEINIRNDSGQIIWFPKGSVTNITLHFKKYL